MLEDLLGLKTCGLKRMVLWTLLTIGGNSSFYGHPSFVFSKKLKALKDCLKVWNKKVFGNVKELKDRVLDIVQTFDDKEGV